MDKDKTNVEATSKIKPLDQRTNVVFETDGVQVTAEELVKALIEGDIETNGGERDWYLASLLLGGCKGYLEMTDEELLESMHQTYGLEPRLDGEAGVDAAEIKRLVTAFDERGVL